MSAPRKIKVLGSQDTQSPSAGRPRPAGGLGTSSPASAMGRSATVNGNLKARVDMSSIGGMAGPSTPPVGAGMGYGRAKATPDGLRTVRARTTPVATAKQLLANSTRDSTPKAYPASRIPFGGESSIPLSSGSAPVTPIASSSHSLAGSPRPLSPALSSATRISGTARSSPVPRRSADALMEGYAALDATAPATVRPARSALGIESPHPDARRGSASSTSALAALSTSTTPPSRVHVDNLLPSPSIPSRTPRSPSKRPSRPTSPLGVPHTTTRTGTESPSLRANRTARSPVQRSSGSSTLSGLSLSSNQTSPWDHRQSGSVSSKSSIGDAPSGISDRLEKAEEHTWVETEAERLARIESEAQDAELKEREGEAKVNRKVLDLQIQNASLLAINATLERTKLKQSNEIRDLRRRMRDKSLAPISSASPGLLSPVSDEFFSGDDSDEEVDFDTLLKEDEKFADVARLLEALLRRASDAIAYQPTEKDLANKKVLTSVEMEAKLAEEEVKGLRLEMNGLLPHGGAISRDSLASSMMSDSFSRDSSPEIELRPSRSSKDAATQAPDPSASYQFVAIPMSTTTSASGSYVSAFSDLERAPHGTKPPRSAPSSTVSYTSNGSGKIRPPLVTHYATRRRSASKSSQPSVRILAGRFGDSTPPSPPSSSG